MILDAPKFGVGICLPRLVRFIETRGIDPDRLAARSLAVVGSNGKGSTARLAAAALAGAGLRVGLFTSPHLFSMAERIRIGEDMIAPDAFERLRNEVLSFAACLPEGERMGAFEILFCIALLWFEERQPDAIVWEAGIGGRYDPIRVVRARHCALTSLELEHAEILGSTEELIAFDKIDALPSGGTLIVSASVGEEHTRRIRAYCRLRDCRVLFAGDHAPLDEVRNTPQGVRFDIRVGGASRPLKCAIRLIGAHQARNAATALLLTAGFAPGMAPEALVDGMGKAFWPGRLEQIAQSPDVWVDVGHTPGALEACFSAFLDIVPADKALLVFGASASKSYIAMSRIASARFPRAILTRAYKDGVDPSSLADSFHPDGRLIVSDISAAAEAAREIAVREGLSVLVAGGLFLAAEFQSAWQGRDPRQLVFL
jgi:dihydrofolate synthase/folylpolyglutamate synthase